MQRQEAEAWLRERIVLKQRHTGTCQQKLKVKEWEQIADNRKRRCSCPYWSCGVHAPRENFKRVATGAFSLEGARDVVLHRLLTGDQKATPQLDNRTTVENAITAFVEYTRDGGAKNPTLEKYTSLMAQLRAYCEWKGIEHIAGLGQEEILEFRRALGDNHAGYKQAHTREGGRVRWTAMSDKTVQRAARVLKAFFRLCILRKWITEDPTVVLRFARDERNSRKPKHDVKYLTADQMTDVVWACDKLERLSPDNRQRLKALILLMRQSGLRLGDAVSMTADKIRGDVLYIQTQKASTKVQIPLPPDLVEVLKNITPYPGGYLFWNRQTEGTQLRTPVTNFTYKLQVVFRKAGVKEKGDGKLAHMLRNTFAVDLLEKGVPLETVSLMLGHQSVQTTERYYADFTKGYMDRAEQLVRMTWTMNRSEELKMKVGGR